MRRAGLFLLIISTHANALNLECLRKENGKCVTVTNEVGKNMARMIINAPKGMSDLLTGASSEVIKPAERNEPKSMQECLQKQNGKQVIDNETVRCRYGYLIKNK